MPLHLRNRLISIVTVASFVSLARLLWPEPSQRAVYLYLAIITVGYGHLLGAAWLSRARIAALRPRGSPSSVWWVFLLATTGVVLAAYAWLLFIVPAALLLFFLFSAWHIVENDHSLGDAYRGGLVLPPVSRRPRDLALHMALTTVVAVVAFVTPEGAASLPWLQLPVTALPLADLFAVVTGYHLVSWILFTVDRANREARLGNHRIARRLLRGLVGAHAVPVAACVVALAAGAGADLPRSIVFGPGLYLFWSVLHAVQTAILRERRAPSAAPARSLTHAHLAPSNPFSEAHP